MYGHRVVTDPEITYLLLSDMHTDTLQGFVGLLDSTLSRVIAQCLTSS